MITENEYLIAQMKLNELRRQRPRLARAYSELEQELKQTPETLQQLRLLFTKLQKITMAGIALHPDVANLEPLLNGLQLSEETITFWRSRLAKELPQGRLRSDLIYIFGALLEEWVHEKTQRTKPDLAETEISTRLLDAACQPTESSPDLAFLDELFAERALKGKDIATRFQVSAKTVLRARITTNELNEVLTHLSVSPFRSATIHRQAKHFLQDSVMCKEMADAFSIQLTHLDEWNWPDAGVKLFPLWTMSKWRLFISYDLFTMCFLEILGTRLQDTFQAFQSVERAQRDEYLLALLKEPSEDEDEVLFQQILDQYRLAENDVWINLLSHPNLPLTFKDLKEFFKRSAYTSSIVAVRQLLREKIQHASTTLEGYESRRKVDGMRYTLQFINAEIQTARVAFPDHPFYVLKLDIKDFYPSLPHDFLIAILERYGFSSSDLAFFRTFLEVQVQRVDEQTSIRRGVPLHHRFSNALGEMVLDLLDQHVLRSARVQVIRLVDDICILTPDADEAVKAWQAAQEFCQRTGLTLNQEKCGAVCIGGSLPEQLPAALPSWLLIKLNEQGVWQVDMEAFATYQEQARQQVLRHPSLLTQIEAYNLHVQYLIRATAMDSDFGEVHRKSIDVVATQFHQAFFGEGQGIVQAIHQTIRERFLDNDMSITLPEAWFYWPITAGGCGLTLSLITASSYAEQWADEEKKTIPTKLTVAWQRRVNDWSNFYSSHINHVEMKAPATTPGMEVLVNDFIYRSNELGYRGQRTLGPYWRWIVYIYGPQILEHLGTFRFLNTELVPLHIILQQDQYALGSDASDTSSQEDLF
ncbi:hypothetical protein KDA_44670 [Dictyobacter alpinus]|uniref:Reverse transcriptase domain-containing protein n=1 Tax=Dictyobacter alpinus TaxID=2014873 RepID=A0A402BC74_9CHLR|nr:reverse transcriptase domain-containing protein [Dictyobacter alpinus]GCE28983.1 hypothetical protein KDA_44670 [Dictyobacter alpinus]